EHTDDGGQTQPIGAGGRGGDRHGPPGRAERVQQWRGEQRRQRLRQRERHGGVQRPHQRLRQGGPRSRRSRPGRGADAGRDLDRQGGPRERRPRGGTLPGRASPRTVRRLRRPRGDGERRRRTHLAVHAAAARALPALRHGDGLVRGAREGAEHQAGVRGRHDRGHRRGLPDPHAGGQPGPVAQVPRPGDEGHRHDPHRVRDRATGGGPGVVEGAAGVPRRPDVARDDHADDGPPAGEGRGGRGPAGGRRLPHRAAQRVGRPDRRRGRGGHRRRRTAAVRRGAGAGAGAARRLAQVGPPAPAAHRVSGL
ncbi:MAG: hypothetical protein AVDCRST_MAG47-1696, partial [uncultured Nocardioidaceae bacterium]